MNRTKLLALIVASIFVASAVVACGEKDDENDGCSATAAQVCAAVFGCGGWGWPDEATCEEHFINSDDPSWSTDCADENGYLSCMCGTVDLTDCAAFGDEEWVCWEDFCY